MKTIAYIFYGVITVLMVDFLGWFAWALSGQKPVDGMFVGAITNSLLKLFF